MGIKAAEPSAEQWNDFPVDIEAVIARLDEVFTPAEAANRRTAASQVRRHHSRQAVDLGDWAVGGDSTGGAGVEGATIVGSSFLLSCAIECCIRKR